MYLDEVLEELHRHRAEHAARFNYDMRAIAEDIRSREGTDGRTVIPPPVRGAAEPVPPVTSESEAA